MPGYQTARTRGQFMEAAWQVAHQYRAHNAYGSERKACAALQRRCPGFTERQYRNAFRKAVSLYDVAAELVADRAEVLLAQTDVRRNQWPDFSDFLAPIRKRCPGFRTSTYRSALVWALFWNHLK